MYEEDVLEAISLFCMNAWQFSSAAIRRKYPRYKIGNSELAIRMLSLERMGAGSIIADASDVLGTLVDIHSMYNEEPFETTHQSGILLANASFAGCQLGGEANEGDLESYAGVFHPQYTWGKGNLRPIDMYEAHLYGNDFPFIEYLHHELSDSIKSLKCLSRSRQFHSGRDHAVSPWMWSPKDGFVLDKDVIASGYHLYTSLLRYLQPTAGFA
jgi:hypothetical protein